MTLNVVGPGVHDGQVWVKTDTITRDYPCGRALRNKAPFIAVIAHIGNGSQALQIADAQARQCAAGVDEARLRRLGKALGPCPSRCVFWPARAFTPRAVACIVRIVRRHLVDDRAPVILGNEER